MNRKSITVLFISIIIITGYIILFPDNLLEQKITALELEEGAFFYNFFYYLSFMGSRIVFVPFVIMGAGYLYFKFKRSQPSIVFISGTLLSSFLNILIKHLVKRDRPSLVEEVYGVGYSFPSGHAMISTVCYGIFVFYLIEIIKKKPKRRLLIISTLILLLLIGYSRIALGVHYFTDVLGGYMIGLLFISLYFKIIKQTSKI